MIQPPIIFSLTAMLAFSSFVIKEETVGEFFLGKASFYSDRFEGKKTAFGEVFSNKHFTAAHRTFAHNTLLEITNIKNGRNVVVRVNDRGPWTKRCVIDVSKAAAQELGMIRSGIGDVRIRVVGVQGELFEHEKAELSARYTDKKQAF